MKLSKTAELLRREKLLVSISGEFDFSSITCDSRKVKKNALFFVKGAAFRKEFLFSALQKGAGGYIAEKDFGIDCPRIRVTDIRLAMPLIAKEFYQNPAARFMLTGVTGTKGKTTVTYMLRNIFAERFGEDFVGMISTNEASNGKKQIEKTGTTPEALPLYEIFDDFAKSGVKAAVMEVSSQALQYNRVAYVPFLNGVYLNLSPDHQSPTEHHSFEEYKNAKLKMLTLCENGIVNIDDKYAKEVISAATCDKIYTFGTKENADFRAEDIILTKRGASFKVSGKYIKDEVFEIRMAGEFNVYNALAAVVCAYLCEIPVSAIKKGLYETEIDGRMEIIEKDGKTIIVDYAHNALSFSAVFDYVEKFYPESKKICLFGCQGNKAYDRRTELPEIAGEKADFVVLTTDDPAKEDPGKILDEVEDNLKKTNVKYVKIPDREEAVRFAVSKAGKGDVVFLAGKGHEHTQIVGNKTVFYKGDMDTAKDELEEK